MKIATIPLFCIEPPGRGIFLISVALLTKKRKPGAPIRNNILLRCIFVKNIYMGTALLLMTMEKNARAMLVMVQVVVKGTPGGAALLPMTME
jgi:hypothetical protein